MARPGLFSHRKFRKLAYALRDEALAVGTLECLWYAAGETCDPRIGDVRDVEAAARWKGAPGVLVPALLDAGFLDSDEGAYVVHHYWDHAPEYVLKRRAREAQRRTSGRRNGPTPTDEVSGHRPDTVRTVSHQRPVTDSPAVQSSSEQSRTEQNREELSRAREQPLSPPVWGRGKPKHQPKTSGVFRCPHNPMCESYTACIDRALAEGKA